jgi:hypothetical protein
MTQPIETTTIDSFDRVGENKVLMQLTVGGKVHAYVLTTSDFVEATKLAAECTQQNLPPSCPTLV